MLILVHRLSYHFAPILFGTRSLCGYRPANSLPLLRVGSVGAVSRIGAPHVPFTQFSTVWSGVIVSLDLVELGRVLPFSHHLVELDRVLPSSHCPR